MIMLGSFYLLDFAAERFPTTTLVWNAFHTVIRPGSVALLALLLLDGQAPLVIRCLRRSSRMSSFWASWPW